MVEWLIHLCVQSIKRRVAYQLRCGFNSTTPPPTLNLSTSLVKGMVT